MFSVSALDMPEDYTAPRICMQEFNPQDQFPNEEEYFEETKEAVRDWELKLQQKERRNNQWIWNLDVGTVFYSPSEPWPEDCYAGISYIPFTYDEKRDGSSLANLRYYDDFPVVEIFYLKPFDCPTDENGPQYIETADSCYDKDIFLNESEYGLLIRHQLGHVFGLDHYEEYYSGEFVPSIMVPEIESNPTDAQITDGDVSEIRKLFPNGFYGINEVIEESKEFSIPQWIRNNAGWWGSDLISDADFIEGIRFLIENEILQLPPTETDPNESSSEIPSWLKENAKWWSKGLISDDDFIKGIQYLIQKGIIVLG